MIWREDFYFILALRNPSIHVSAASGGGLQTYVPIFTIGCQNSRLSVFHPVMLLPLVSQSLGSKKIVSLGNHVIIHNSKFDSALIADSYQGHTFIIYSPAATPSLKLPLDTPSVHYAIILVPAT